MMRNPSLPIKLFEYEQSNYVSWLRAFSEITGGSLAGNTLSFQPPVGSGKCTVFELEQGFTACLNDFKLVDNYLFKRVPNSQPGVIIYLYVLQNESPMSFELNDLAEDVEPGKHYSLRVIDAQTLHNFVVGPATEFRGISIFLEHKWLENNLGPALKTVFSYLKQVNYFRQFINAKQLMLLNEILNLPADHPFPEIFIRSRILRIFDKLLEHLVQYDIAELPEKISGEDFKALQKIEAQLTASYLEAFPGIEKLSRISLMSESKLKKLFKQSFGMGLYEYYQKNRMHRAKEYIISGKYTISEVGSRLGYQNMSNFSSAFRKEFNCLPSELV